MSVDGLPRSVRAGYGLGSVATGAFGTVPGLPIPWPFTIYLALAIVLGVLLHRTWIGRQIYAMGQNQSASRYSGIRVARIKLLLFVLVDGWTLIVQSLVASFR